MAEIVYELMEERASKGFTHDYYTNTSNSNSKFRDAPYIYQTLMDMVEVDPVLFTAISLTADITTYKGYDFISQKEDDNKQLDEIRKRFNNELDFDRAIKNILWSLLVYGDAYLEIRWDTGKTKVMELNARDTMDMRIDYDEHGEIKGYVEEIQGKPPEKFIKYEPDEIMRFSLYLVGSQVYSRNPFKAIARDFSTGMLARDYVHGIFANLPPKVIYFLKNGNEKQRKELMQNLIISKRNPGMDIIAQGEEFDAKVASLDFTGLTDILNWNTKRILMITRVPPHWIGLLDGANRGIGENVVIPYETRVKCLQHEIASQVNKELMPKLGYSDEISFKFNAISLVSEETISKIMVNFNSVGMDGKSILDYARSHGLNLRDDAEIEKITPPNQIGGAPQPGEEGKKKGEKDPIGNKLNAQGVSPEGKRKLDAKKVSA